MNKELIQVFYLAAMSDGKLHDQEREMITQYARHFIPQSELKNLNISEITNNMHSLINAGLKADHFFQEMKKNLNSDQLNTLYALGLEMCCINFELVNSEIKIINDMEEIWNISKSVRDAIKRSAKLRFRKLF